MMRKRLTTAFLVVATLAAVPTSWACYGNRSLARMKTQELVDELADFALMTESVEMELSFIKPVIREMRSRGRTSCEAMWDHRKKLAMSAHRQEGATVESVAAAAKRFDLLCDQVAGQRFSTASKLFWHTSMTDAQKEAKKRNVPILSLRMLGRLDEDMSCANSRFFRTVLYPAANVSERMRNDFVLHWATIREVPKVTIDFGNGRKLERPLTGNSMHMVLDSSGKPIDAMPGLVGASIFFQWLAEAKGLADELVDLKVGQRERRIVEFHAQRNAQRFQAMQHNELTNIQDLHPLHPKWNLAAEYYGSVTSLPNASVALIQNMVSAEKAMPIAVSKSAGEAPLLQSVRNLGRTLARDTAYNLLALQPKIDQIFMRHGVLEDQQLTNRTYDQVFLMPLNDPWLGLSPEDQFMAIENRGRTEPQQKTNANVVVLQQRNFIK